MFTFSIPGYTTLFIFLILCLAVLYITRKRIKSRILKRVNLPYKKYGLTGIIVGSIVSIISVIFYLKVQRDIIYSPGLLRPISEMTSEPVILLTITAFFIGITILLIGIYYIRLGSKMINNIS
ncbi:hypothetical protein CH333_03220 [candidate division WOR-3 bacterium JGI_Cruoil_03_44_89]|uniref:Uncharacterized protein n=1 Tax=candidate division WOR-3 bacterium JGI_Cruoil_03_44_89 TaxID=1973748 RepID=A0A235BWE5_UNCW3|nr:MAG: hypothetical protein CH333_03220 [candidate division WOR-3 bacterium JGI_Cruoil_03_44_89]